MSPVSLTLISFELILISISHATKETFDYQDRTCDSHNCFLDILKSYGDCQLSEDKQLCYGTGCKFIGNSNMRMCVNPTELSQQTFEELRKRVLESSVSIGSQQLCIYDDNNNVYDILCKKMNGTQCHPSSKKCVMTSEQYSKVDEILENDIKKDHILYELPYNYTNNILIVVDGTSTKGQFEADEYDAIKGGEYKLKEKARWANGNWANHASNFYEDYRGAKYYWYGPDNVLKIISAGREVLGLVEGTVDVICEFISNHTGDFKDINIDLIGYSRGGYTVMETARLLDRDGCSDLNINGHEIKIRFMGLYDPVSTIYGDVIDENFNDDDGLFANENYHYNADIMPSNVDHIVISYGEEKLGSRQFFNTLEDIEDRSRNEIEREYYITTHGGIGGTPMYGDFEEVMACIQNDGWKNIFGLCRFMSGLLFGDVEKIDGYGANMECLESMKADMFIRNKAYEYGLPIDKTNEDYYQFYRCSEDFKDGL